AASSADPYTRLRHAICSLSDSMRHEGVYAVLKVDRVLSGDPADIESYLKPAVKASRPSGGSGAIVTGTTTPANVLLDAQVVAALKKSRQYQAVLSEFRQSVAWGMTPLFDQAGRWK